MAILGHLGLEAESGAAVGPDFEKLARPGALLRRLLPEQRECKLVARVEQGDGLLALAGAVGNATHFVGVARTLLGDRLAPDTGLGEGPIAIEPGSGEAAQIGRDIAAMSCANRRPCARPRACASPSVVRNGTLGMVSSGRALRRAIYIVRA